MLERKFYSHWVIQQNSHYFQQSQHVTYFIFVSFCYVTSQCCQISRYLEFSLKLWLPWQSEIHLNQKKIVGDLDRRAEWLTSFKATTENKSEDSYCISSLIQLSPLVKDIHTIFTAVRLLFCTPFAAKPTLLASLNFLYSVMQMVVNGSSSHC